MLELRRGELLDALGIDGLIVATELEETRADGAAEEVVSAERVEAHVAAGRDELGTGEVVEGEVVVEELGDIDNILFRGGFTSGTDLVKSNAGRIGFSASGEKKVKRLRNTLRKNSLNASEPTMCALAFRPDSRSVSCKNLAISRRTRRSFRAFSSYKR